MFLCKTISGELSGNGAHARNRMTHIADSQYATRVSLYAPFTTARCAPYYALRLNMERPWWPSKTAVWTQ